MVSSFFVGFLFISKHICYSALRFYIKAKERERERGGGGGGGHAPPRAVFLNGHTKHLSGEVPPAVRPHAYLLLL